MVTTNGQLYECGNTSNSLASFTLDASSAINDNQGEGINFNWQLKEDLAGAIILNPDSAIATLQITDDGIVNSDNVERVIEIITIASQAGVGGETQEVSSELILRKPPVDANTTVTAVSCDGLISTSNSISCTGNTARITVDAGNSVNPNNGGIYVIWSSEPSANIVTSDQHSTTFEVSNLPTTFTSYTFTAEAFDNPNHVNSSIEELSLAMKRTMCGI